MSQLSAYCMQQYVLCMQQQYVLQVKSKSMRLRMRLTHFLSEEQRTALKAVLSRKDVFTLLLTDDFTKELRCWRSPATLCVLLI